LWLVWKILGPLLKEPSIRWAVLLLAAAPASILVSGFHGNTDPVMIFFLLLTVYLIDRNEWLAGASFGLAMCVKVVPIVLLPILVLRPPGLRRQIAFCAAAAGVVALGWFPFFFEDPRHILGRLFGYRSLFGTWGISFLAWRYAPASVNSELQARGPYLLLAVLLIAAVWMDRVFRRQNAFTQIGVSFFLMLSLSTGFGVQYLAWLTPWVAGFGLAPAAIYHLSSGVFLFVVYNCWARGLPWYLANSVDAVSCNSVWDYFQVVCWLSICCCCVLIWMAGKDGTLRGPKFLSKWQPMHLWLAGAFLAAIVLIYPAQRELRTLWVRPDARQQGEAKLRGVRSLQFVELSFQLLRIGRNLDAIWAANTALNHDPMSAAAYNNLIVSYGNLGRWDEAIVAGKNALRLRPGFPLARNNLAWAEANRGRNLAGTPKN
jgi:glycosyl transferase family 87